MEHRVLSFKIKTNKKFEDNFNKILSATRFVYNCALETKRESYKKGLKLSNYDLQKQLTEAKKEVEFLKEVDSQCLNTTLDRLDKSYNNFYRGGGYPKFAKKKNWKSVDFKKQGFYQKEDKSFKLPKIGVIKVFKSFIIKEDIRKYFIIKKADGYYLNIIVKLEITKIQDEKQVIGIDLGISEYCVTSKGEVFNNPKIQEQLQNKLKKQQRKLENKKRGSVNWYKQVNLIQKTYLKIKRKREDFHHKLSTTIAKEHSYVAVEDLKIQKMLKVKKLSFDILDAGWYSFKEKLKYKTNVIEVNPAYTSQKCSKCGHTCKKNRKKQADFKCVKCKNEMNADYNASQNILSKGIAILQKQSL